MRGKRHAVNAKMTVYCGERLGDEKCCGEEVGGETPPHQELHSQPYPQILD